MEIVDILTKVLEKHGLSTSVISDTMKQVIASEVAELLEKEDKHSIWSTESKEALTDSLVELKLLKVEANKGFATEQKRIDLSNLIFKIEELLLTS